MAYVIRANYRTGDSFGSNDETTDVEMKWDSLDVAKENLRRIDEHNRFYCELHGHSERTRDEIIREVSAKPWYASRFDFCLNLVANNGETFQYSAPWVGYFEKLESVEIVEDEPEERGLRIEY